MKDYLSLLVFSEFTLRLMNAPKKLLLWPDKSYVLRERNLLMPRKVMKIKTIWKTSSIVYKSFMLQRTTFWQIALWNMVTSQMLLEWRIPTFWTETSKEFLSPKLLPRALTKFWDEVKIRKQIMKLSNSYTLQQIFSNTLKIKTFSLMSIETS